MALTVWKYSATRRELLNNNNQMAFHIPVGAQFVSVHEQGDAVCLWFLVETEAPRVPRRFVACMTGAPAQVEQATTFLGPLGSCRFEDGYFMLHIFEVIPYVSAQGR